PAVPLNRADEEYVSGRMTQAEILEKYGLHQQALEQVREVTAKFPGHVPAQEKLVLLEREGGTAEGLSRALVAVALARRAAGDADGARQACAEASRIGPLEPATLTMLAQLGLIDRARPTAARAAVVPPAPSREPRPAPAPAAFRPAAAGRDDTLFIDFDAMDDEDAATPAEPSPKHTTAPPPPGVTTPPAAADQPDPASEVVAEVERLLAVGETAEAERRLVALETLGWAADAARSLRQRIDAAKASMISRSSLVDSDLADDDDLSAITAALESELFADEMTALDAEPESEQSLEEVFAAFKQHVDREVGSEDYRTHYELGIGYKEMGLMDEAIAAFEQAVRSPEFGRDAYAMLAVCHRERDDLEAAARCYREAIARPGSDPETVKHLRYDLADVLLIAGDRAGALVQLRGVLGADPTFRDVRQRVAELESLAS
ncbi:MAG TPA: tetratricopeptide repeat protein, partial [Candidatus Polarisedimenticolaceae bacterium]|nr:tetratricopeptide repeat protein [Candidatus Polarisedimenticolaceae bacterium]